MQPFHLKPTNPNHTLATPKKSAKTTRTTRRFWWLFIVLMLLSGAFWVHFFYKHHKLQEAAFVRYPDFGIDLPNRYPIHGIDVSKHQSYIHWPSVKAMKADDVKIGFVFIKATEGLRNVDRHFKRNWRNAAEARMPRGAYHFFLATKSGSKQADNFTRTVHLSPGDLPPVLDIEQLYGVAPAKMRKEALAWLQQVEQHYGVKPIVYTNVYFYEKYLNTGFDDYPLWVAHYLVKARPRIQRPWSFWQHSEAGKVNGIKNKVDFNVFNGDSTAFKKLLVPAS